MKKAQIEIIGLAVIIIILAVGLIIALTFILRPKINTLEDQRQSIRATAFINALLDTNINLEDNTNTTKLKDQITNCYPDQLSCKTILNPILNKLFKNQDYILRIKQNPDPEISIISNSLIDLGLVDCQINRDRVVTDPVIIVAAPRMEVKLTICSPKF